MGKVRNTLDHPWGGGEPHRESVTVPAMLASPRTRRHGRCGYPRKNGKPCRRKVRGSFCSDHQHQWILEGLEEQ